MDKSQVKDLLLTKFKPKVLEDFKTPYLVTEDGESLDGELKLVGLPGQEALKLKQMSIVKRLDIDGTEKMVYDDAKLASLAIIKCLYHRGSNEPLLDQLIPTQGPQAGNAPDLPAILGLDFNVFNQLGEDVLSFLGMGGKAAVDAKKNSTTTSTDESSTSSSNSQPDSAEPSANSSTESTPAS